MKALLFALMATAALGAGTARAQETKAHQHEHVQPPPVPEEKVDEKAEHKEMCACCRKDGDSTDAKAAMMDKMKDMMKKEKKS